jgi:hypothetical protein
LLLQLLLQLSPYHQLQQADKNKKSFHNSKTDNNAPLPYFFDPLINKWVLELAEQARATKKNVVV